MTKNGNGNGRGFFHPLKIFFHIFDFLWEREDTETGVIDITDSETVIQELADDEDNLNDRN